MSESATPVTVVIADDHRLMREGTAALLQTDPRISVIGMAADGQEALSLVARRKPDVVLLDLEMPRIGGLEACAAIRELDGDVAVLILTVSEKEPDLWAVLRMGAAGYLLKDMPPGELIDAVLQAGRGEPRIAPRMAARMLRAFAAGDRTQLDPLLDLTVREREVLGLLAEGMSNREMAASLFVSEATIKTHVRHILEKLRLRNRTEAAAYAARHLR